MKPRALITTAAGRTGSVAALELVRRGHPVRGLVRRDDHRARALRDAGVEVVVGDLFDWRDLTNALDGVQLAYHCPPFDAQHLHGATMFALAAEQAGVEVVALMSGWNPHQLHRSVFQREHWLANNLYRRQAFDVIHINPGMFAWTYFLGLPAIVRFGMLALPLGDGLNAPPSNEDVGRVAAMGLALRIAITRAIDLDEWEQTRDYPLIANGLLAHENPDWEDTAQAGLLSLLSNPS